MKNLAMGMLLLLLSPAFAEVSSDEADSARHWTLSDTLEQLDSQSSGMRANWYVVRNRDRLRDLVKIMHDNCKEELPPGSPVELNLLLVVNGDGHAEAIFSQPAHPAVGCANKQRSQLSMSKPPDDPWVLSAGIRLEREHEEEQ